MHSNTFLKTFRKKNNLGYFVVIVIPFVTFLLGLTVGYHQAKYDLLISTNGDQNNASFSQEMIVSPRPGVDLSLFWKVWDILESSYIDTSKLDTQQMVYGAIKGMVSSLSDPYTLFMNPKETEDFRNSLSGDLQGIGTELSIKDGHLVVVSPLKNSPAEQAGIKPGDIIYKIDGVLTTNMSLTDAVSRIRGPKGTTVSLVILRENNNNPLELTITRQDIKVPSVSWEMKVNTIAYISINQFGDDTTKEFNNAVNEILLKKPKGVILDLRFNGGGYLDGAVDIVSEFIDSGVVTTVKKRTETGKENVEVQKVNGHARLGKLPLVVLINEGSASASEIVAGAVQDYKRGTLIGTKSFGKGTVQELQPLSDGSSLRITIAKWFTPNNKNIDQTGIVPDIVIPTSNVDEQTKKDPQLDKAISFLQDQFK
jgi:carboxyl-terminal processing protease